MSSIEPEPAPPLPPRPAESLRSAALQPLSDPAFRLLWGTWLTANLCMWMNDVAAAWTMTSLTTKPIWVALVQSASTLPVFLLGLPSGALADILDRRRWLVATQFWLAATATALCAVTAAGLMTAPWLLVLVFANGIGLALRWPVFAAIVPELVPRSQLASALALNGMAMNLSRIVGPLVAGALIASAGSVWVFALNAVLSLLAGFVVLRWRHEHPKNPLGRERLVSAMRVGVQFVRQSPRMRAVLSRVSLFFFNSTALLALLPLVARGLAGGDAGTFTLLLACMGAGAIVAVLALPRLRQAYGRDDLVIGGAVVQSLRRGDGRRPSAVGRVRRWSPPRMAWITVATRWRVGTDVAAELGPGARHGHYQMAIMGASRLGAALWGQVATLGSIQNRAPPPRGESGAVDAARGALVTDSADEMRLARPRRLGGTAFVAPPKRAVVTTVEILHRSARARAFVQVLQETRRARLSQGAIGWELLHDIGAPERFVEEIVDESWTRAPAPLPPRHRRRPRPARAAARLPPARRAAADQPLRHSALARV
jgi:MFS family permease